MKRHEILVAIGDRLREVTIPNGYHTDIGVYAAYWATDLTEYGAAAVTWRDPEEETVTNNRFHDNSLSVELEAIVFTTIPLLDGCLLLADLIKAVGTDPTWGGLASKTDLIGNEKTVETSGQTAVRIILNLQILYRTPLFNP